MGKQEKLKNYFIAVLLITGLAGFYGCATKSIVGTYNSTSNNKIAFAGKSITLNKDHTFLLNEWSDSYSITVDENGNVKCQEPKGRGKGIYRTSKDTLILHFTNNDFISCEVEIIESKNSYEIRILAKDELSQPLQAVTIVVQSKDNKSLEAGMTNEFGTVDFIVAKDLNPELLDISTFAAERFKIEIEKAIGKNNYRIKRCIGYYKKDATEKFWFKKKGKRFYYKKRNDRLVKLERVN